MSGLGFNKVAGAVLATTLAIVGLREMSSIVYGFEPAEKAGYAIEVVEEAEAGAVAEVAPDWGTVLPVANVAAGNEVHKKCLSCHTVEKGGANLTGPNLWGVVGRRPASHAGFAYSAPMTAFAAANPSWTYEQLDQFVKAPQKHIPGTKMTFVGIKKQPDRINLIAYLRSMSDAPMAVPAPRPAPAAAAAGEPVAAPPGTPPGDASRGPVGAAPVAGPAAAPTQTNQSGGQP